MKRPVVRTSIRFAAARVRRRLARGFTLIELLVTIAISVILLTVAAPGFIDFRRNSALADAVSSFIVATSTAKASSLKTGRNSFLVPNDTAVGWRSGWFVYSDKNWNDQFDDTDEVVLTFEALSPDITLTLPTGSFNDGYIMFTGNGFPRLKLGGLASGRLTMSVPSRSSSLIMDTAGRVRSCKTDSTGC